MTSLTQRYSEMAGGSRKLESQAQKLTSDAARLHMAISNMNTALENFSVNGPMAVLRRAAEEIRLHGFSRPAAQPALMAAE